jgi:hypothetical protein
MIVSGLSLDKEAAGQKLGGLTNNSDAPPNESA